MPSLCSCTGLVGPVPKERWQLSWANCGYGRNLGLLVETKLEMPINWRFSSSKKVCTTQCAVKVMFIVAYNTDGVILHHAVPPRQMVNAAYCTFLVYHLCPWSGENDDTWWYRIPSFFMTMQGVTPLLLSRTSCAIDNRKFWNIYSTHLIWVHGITISLPKWKNHCEGPDTTKEMNLSML